MRLKKIIVLAAAAFASVMSFAASVWRGETAYVNIPERSAQALLPLNGTSQDGVEIHLAYYDDVAYETKPGGVDMRVRPDVYREIAPGQTGAKAPTVCRITASADAKPGKRSFGPMSVEVVDRVLPPAKDWKYFLDLWQHPWAVSRYFNVEPFSKEHYAKMEPVWRALAECGCKALTVTLLDLPWNNQCLDGYYSMVGRVKNADGTWSFDYSLFDEYVEFGRKCGLGPDIACYTMCPWGYRVTWKDAAGKDHREEMLPGTPEFNEYWGPFLVDFAKHLKSKGWFEDAYIAMDERKPEDVRAIATLVQEKAPGMKIAMCGNKSPAQFENIKIENFCLGLIHLRKKPEFLNELEPRRKEGFKTTFYVCCTAPHPNTFMESPEDEGFWLGAYPVLVGFDGFLRWAANSWPKDPYKDASYRTTHWKAGDTFLIYPGGELSSRLISLRAGVVAAEKLLIMNSEADIRKDMKRLAAPYGYKAAVKNRFSFADFRRGVENYVNSTAPRSSIKVGSYNIRLSGVDGSADRGTPNAWMERKDDLVDLIRKLDLDVFGLQEVCPDQAAFLREKLSDYNFVGEHRGADRISDEASPVCYRKSRFEALDKGTFWLSETPDVPGVIGWGAMCPRVCSYLILKDRVTGKKFCFANCHTDHKSAEAREKGMMLVIERMKKFGAGAPIIFTGDHNCREDEAPALAVSKVLKDALYLSETEPMGSWRSCNGWRWRDSEFTISEALSLPVAERNAKSNAKKYGVRIDYIYVSDGVRVFDYETVNCSRFGKKLYPSDHFPVVATIGLE